ncbi:MAG: hypothetical protein KDJ46_03330, partial [Rhodobiaceae bacterium]|nr:hypothetical protein [Rhodobiaceae bacterium]
AAAPGRRPGVLVFGSGALAGGVVALVLYAGLAQIGVMPAAPGAAGLEARIQDLETHLGDVRDELAGQSGRATRLPEGLARGEEVAALERRIGALETGAAEATGGKAGDALKGFEERLAGLAAQVAAAEQAALSARGEVDILTARLAAQSGSPASAAAAEALGQRLNAAEQAAARAQEAAGAAVRAGEGAILALREQMGQEIGAQAKSLSQRLDTLSADLAALRQQAATDAAQGPGLQARAALAIAIAGLERTMLAGTPFGRELQAVAALSAPGNAQVAALERLAATGVPRADQLAETFAGVAGAIVDAGSRAGGDGLVGRLMANARALVRVRPTGAVSGESTAAVVARIEQKLSAGDLAGAVDEAGALDGAARDAADGWLNSARAALGAREQVRLLAEQAAAGLAAEGGVHKQ